MVMVVVERSLHLLSVAMLPNEGTHGDTIISRSSVEAAAER